MKRRIKSNQYIGGVLFAFMFLTNSISNLAYSYDEVQGYDYDMILEEIEYIDFLEEENWKKYRTSKQEIRKNILGDIKQLSENIEEIQEKIKTGDYPPSYKRQLINWKYEYEMRRLDKKREYRKYSR